MSESAGSESAGSESAASGDGTGTGRRWAVIVISIALPIALLAAVIVAAVIAQREPERQRVAVAAIPTPEADSAACTDLGAALPETVGPYTRAEIDDPAPPATYAWQRSLGGDAIVLRCGIDQPLEFVVGSSLQSVNGVQWFQATAAAQTLGTITYIAVDRDVYIALSAPPGDGPTPLQTISDAISATLPATDPKPLPLPN